MGKNGIEYGLISCAILWSLNNRFLMSFLDHSASSAGVDEILNVRNFIHAFIGTVDHAAGPL